MRILYAIIYSVVGFTLIELSGFGMLWPIVIPFAVGFAWLTQFLRE
ncbi:hypothetical protein [Pseudovibrio ascidiaceicola]|nr:hypothetical protein [Pseudovibrio ascidiaceicola]